ncbi:MAG: FAD:protein FMN transferase [Ilumatobacter sp.]
MTEHVFSHAPVLGTVLTVSVARVDLGVARAIDRRVLDEVERLEAMLSRFRADSALERWKRDELAVVPLELGEVLARSAVWMKRTRGVLNPRSGALVERWRAASEEGRVPSSAELRPVLDELASPGFEVDEAGIPRRVGDCTHLDLHAFAKGWIVDRALSTATGAAPAAAVLVSAGGDIARIGPGAAAVAIEDPLRPYDNAAPVDRVMLRRGGLATSGVARRGIRVGARTYSHIVNPRTGFPADGAVSVSVVAPSAEAADAWATALSLASAHELVHVADDAGVAAMAVLHGGAMVANDRWCRLQSPR